MTEETISNLKQKIAKYCAYRERCTKEVVLKLQESGTTQFQIEKIIDWLEDEKYLDNSRFAVTFARGKFRNNKWGRQRIILELKSRGIDETDIKMALKEIDPTEYQVLLQKLAKKKWKEIKEVKIFVKEQKTAAFLVGKGFEADLVWDVVKNLK